MALELELKSRHNDQVKELNKSEIDSLSKNTISRINDRLAKALIDKQSDSNSNINIIKDSNCLF